MLEGIVQNGIIVLKNGASLPEGTRVTVSVAASPSNIEREREGSFFRSTTLDELAANQGITSPCTFDNLLGGWPEEDRDDKFENAVAAWRKEEVRKGEF